MLGRGRVESERESATRTATTDNLARFVAESLPDGPHVNATLAAEGRANVGFLTRVTPRKEPLVLKGFKEFLSRGNVIDLAVAVVIGAAFTGLVGCDKEYGILKISLGGNPEQFVDFNAVLAAVINFVIVAAVLYFVIMLPYKKLRERGEVEQAQDTELSLLTEIRDLLSDGGDGKHVTGPGTGPSPDTAEFTSADRADKH